MATEDPREYPPDNAAQNPRRCVVRATIKPLDASLYLDKKFIGTSADILKSGILVDRVGQIFAVIRPGYRDVNLILGGAECTKGIDVVLEKNR